MEFINPLSGGHAMPIIAAFIPAAVERLQDSAVPLH
jgi:gentisate 1,2-dioxygenase